MAIIPFPPSDHPEHHEFGNDVALVAGADIPTRIALTVAAFRAAMEAENDVSSGTTLAERVAQEAFYPDNALPDDPPTMRAGIQSVQDALDLGLDIVDVWVYLPTGGDRGVGWPSLEDDQTAILLILGAMAP